MDIFKVFPLHTCSAIDLEHVGRPFSRFNLVPVGGRSTAVVLSGSGGNSSPGATLATKKAVWVLASTPLDGPTRAKLDELGEVKYIIGPDAVHSLFLGTRRIVVSMLKTDFMDRGLQERISKCQAHWGRRTSLETTFTGTHIRRGYVEKYLKLQYVS